MMKTLLYFTSLLFFSHSFAAGNLGAHVHGVAGLDIAVEGKQVLIMFKSPADSILGFEYKPKTRAEKRKVVMEKKTWNKQIYKLIGGEDFKNCKSSESSWLQKFSGPKHSEILAEILLTCSQNVSSKTLKVSLKKHYPKIETLHVQLIKQDGSALSKKYTAKEFQVKL